MKPFTFYAMQALTELIKHQRFITSDDLYPHLEVAPDDPNEMGPVFNNASKQGYLRKTGRFVPSTRSPAKHRNVQVWESYVFRNEPNHLEELETFTESRTRGAGQPVTNQGGLF